MTAKIKELKSLEDVKNIKVGDIIGMEQLLSSSTIPTLCGKKEGEFLTFLGYLDDKTILKYNLRIGDIEAVDEKRGLYFDRIKHPILKIFPTDQEYNKYKEELIEGGLIE